MEQPAKTPLYAWYAPALLMVVWILNFLGRSISYLSDDGHPNTLNLLGSDM